MKTLLAFATSTILLAGCASAPHSYVGKDGVTYTQDKDIQGVWLAPGFDFNGYDTLYITEPTSDAESRSDEEKNVLATAKRTLRQELAAALGDNHVFKKVVTSTNDIPSTGKTLVLENNIYYHEKGGGGARYWAGLFGGGQPIIKVLGKMNSNQETLFRYDMTRSGESGGAKMGGVFMSDESIQTEDIRDLARDLADYIKHTAEHTPRK